MANERPIIIQQTQSQTQNGCCAGSGCGTIFLILLAFSGLGAVWGAMAGDYGTGWQIAAWIGVPLLIILVVGGGIGLAGERFGWFSDAAPEPEQKDAADVIIEDEMNYGAQSPTDDLEDRLRRLARLRDQGLITDEDYETQKRRLLDEA